MKVLLRFDGSCDDNGSSDATGGIGWHVDDYDSGAPIGEGFDCLPGRGVTNNVAEWTALIEGLRWVSGYLPMTGLVIEGDSQLVIEQLLGNWKCKKPHLKALRETACELLAEMGVKYAAYWIPREKNERADELSTRKKAPPPQPLRRQLDKERICDFAAL